MAERGVFYLKIVEGKDCGETILLQGDVISLGGGVKFEATDERIVFADSAMAGVHAVLIWQPRDNTYLISNRSVANPITVNGNPSGHALLIPGMRLGISHIVLEVSADNYAGPAESCAAPATIKAEHRMYLGEMPEGGTNKETPAWLSQDAQAPSRSKIRASWDDIVEIAEQDKAASAVKSAVSLDKSSEALPEAKSQLCEAESSQGAVMEQETYSNDEPAKEEEPASPSPLGVLLVVRGANKGKSIEVFGDVLVGRSPDCDLVLSDNSVSRQHCKITFEDGKAYISNISSSNTTKLGSSKVKRASLPSPADITLANKVQLRWTATK